MPRVEKFTMKSVPKFTMKFVQKFTMKSVTQISEIHLKSVPKFTMKSVPKFTMRSVPKFTMKSARRIRPENPPGESTAQNACKNIYNSSIILRFGSLRDPPVAAQGVGEGRGARTAKRGGRARSKAVPYTLPNSRSPASGGNFWYISKYWIRMNLRTTTNNSQQPTTHNKG